MNRTHEHPGRGFGRHFGPGERGGDAVRGRGRGRGFGGGGRDFGHDPDFRGRGRGPGGRMRRGDIRTALLSVLNEGPGHGYDIMRRLEEKSAGAWRPSAGSVYPTLQQLEDEGLATSAESEGKRVYTITEVGTAEAERRVAEAGGDLWSHGFGSGVHPGMLFRSMGGLAFACKQAVAAGLTAAQLAKAIEIVEGARQQIYRLLADGPAGGVTDDRDDVDDVDNIDEAPNFDPTT